MKIYFMIYMYFFLFMPLIIMFMFMNLYYFKVLCTPFKQMLYLILYSMIMSIFIYMDSKSFLYPMMIMITYISGVMVLFSYFVSLMNLPIKNSIEFMVVFMVTLSIFLLFIKMFQPYFYFIKYSINKKLNCIDMMYFYPNSILMIIMIMLLVFMLYLSFKICFLKKKALRRKF